MASDGKGLQWSPLGCVAEVCKSAKVISGVYRVLLGGTGVEWGRIEIIVLCVCKITRGR